MQHILWLFSVTPRAVEVQRTAKSSMFEQSAALYLKQMQ